MALVIHFGLSKKFPFVSSLLSLNLKVMELNDGEEEEFGFSRNYFLAKDLAASGKKSIHKLSDINLVDEQVLAFNFT